VSYSKGSRVAVHSGNTLVGHFIGTGDDRADMEECARVLREAGLEQPKPSIAQCIRDQARAFANVATDLAMKIMELRGQSRDCVAPFLVNAAFALELFLKSLAQQHGKEMRGHSLLKLFDELPTAARDSIDKAFAGAPDFLAGFDESSDLRGLFVNLDDAFVAWRYAYEGQAEGRFFGAKAALLLLAVLDEATAPKT